MTWLHRFAKCVVASTVVLIAAGGMVTSTGSGLAVPDWPNTYGWFMFSFPVDKMVGGILYEHGHRLIASTVGFLTVILAVWIWRVDPRAWMKKLGAVALAAVILQGLLGGLTVLLLLPAPVSISHAGLAQLFFCSTIAIALFTSPGWHSSDVISDDRVLRTRAATTTCLIYLQIVLGATMRHGKAGLAIPDFPLAFGSLIPPYWNAAIAIHFAHRVGAVVVLAAVLVTTTRVWTRHRSNPGLRRPALLLSALVLVQGTLGAFVVWSGLQSLVNTAHVVNGALVLGTSLVLALRSARPLCAGVPAPRHSGTQAPRHPGTQAPLHPGAVSGART
ncbi:MAG: COX15/CtaA family protein [Chloroflexota bacterium]